ncbi:unnamed protein product [Rotaria sp. Silwood2]|nr:unnamed protein product [Rotaria sp. Silwood2]CAF4650574.1 unnamed protein product [Rotaria sp. Silwood2]
MLRSEKVQVCSQLSTIQRRMLQEKQQIMDYLRRIEDDLIEKEQNLQQEYLQLLKKDNEKLQLKLELNTYKLEIKRLYSHFNINIDSIEQLIPTLEDRLLQTSSISSTSELNNEYEQLEKILQI